MKIKEIILKKLGTVIDVRNPGELAEGAFPGAVNIPVHEIPSRIEEIKKMKGPLVLYCRSGNRSGMAIAMLKTSAVNTEMYNGGSYYDMLTYLN
ncbi:MAG: rhodanese-like domain-containing protein [Bacteroidota bacterium]|nr:rhodanese-like domain-containing protein [Bacteroidota bacterium]